MNRLSFLQPRTLWCNVPGGQRVIWVVGLTLFLLHIAGLAAWMLFTPDFGPTLTAGPPDLVVYHLAAEALQARQPLYLLTPWPDPLVYYYHPAFALVHAWLLVLPFRLVAIGTLLVQVASFIGAWWVWQRVLRDLRLEAAATAFVAWLPLGLLYTQSIAHLLYLNITGTLCLLAGLLTWALVRGHAPAAVLAALPILLVKPHWLFPLVLLLAFRQWRLLARVLGGLFAGYTLVNAAYIAIVGPTYGLSTLREYIQFLSSIQRNFPWSQHGPPFASLNHSLQQVLFNLGGQSYLTAGTIVVTLVVFAVLGGAIALAWQQRRTLDSDPILAVLFVWLGYLTTAALLGQLWGLDAGMFAFACLWAVFGPSLRRVVLPFLLYAFWEVWALLAFVLAGDALWLPQRVPLTLLALVLLFGVTVYALYQALTVRIHKPAVKPS